MRLAIHSVDIKRLADSAIPVGASRAQSFPPPSLPLAIPGDLSDSKEERMDQASAAPNPAAADCARNYASLCTLDFSVIPTAQTLQRFHAWRFGERSGFQQY